MTLASLFELASRINAWQNQQAKLTSISGATFEKLKSAFNLFVTEVLGLKNENPPLAHEKMNEVMQLLISLRNEARTKKDFATSDKIRNELMKAGIQLKDGKEGTTWGSN
jgi:cysteinyl-tRNA synthetase